MANGTIAFDTLTTSDSKNTNTEKSIDTSYLFNGVAKVWGVVTSAAAITNSFNLSTGTDHGTGDYSYALTTAFGNVNHATTAVSSGAGAGRICTSNTARTATGTIAIEIEGHAGSSSDDNQELSTHGDLA